MHSKIKARETQHARQNCINADLSAKACEQVCQLETNEQHFISQALSRLKLSARGFHRLLKVARTIADMGESEKVCLPHLQQALSFKQGLQLPK